jgi:S1-C subfamily serine protease
LEAAKRQAARERKDILIVFGGSDWCERTQRFARDVLFQPDFGEPAAELFVLVFVDSPRGAAAKTQVQDAARNQRLLKHYRIDTCPTVVLTDAEGRPYAFPNREQHGGSAYWSYIMQLRSRHDNRDTLFTSVAQEQGRAQVKAVQEAVEFLLRRGLTRYYGPQLQEWVLLAGKQDPQNQHGHVERIFEYVWCSLWYSQRDELNLADPAQLQEAIALARQLDEWKKHYQFRDVNRAALMHLLAGLLLAVADQPEQATRYFKEGLAHSPSEPDLARCLGKAVKGELAIGSGTGFVVAAGGYVLTNYHVIKGPGRLVVTLPPGKEPIPAEVIAHDEGRDMALLRLKTPVEPPLQPLALAGQKPVNIGLEVATLGYGQGPALGTNYRLRHGLVNGVPQETTKHMLSLDMRLDPGNSGGPLFDKQGNVVAMVTAKIEGGDATESIGLALPAQYLQTFLQQRLKDYKPAALGTEKLDWEEVAKRHGPSVVMVQKVY